MEIIPFDIDLLDLMIYGTELEPRRNELVQSYFSFGSVSECLLSDGFPVFAGGIVNAGWNRGVAWMLPTRFFRLHPKTCYKIMRRRFPDLANGFVRVQAECLEGMPASLILHMGFKFEGRLQKFGPNGETCRIFARIFEVAR